MNNVFLQGLHLLLRPIVRFCLRRSLGLQDLIEAARVVFIKVAAEEMEKEGKKVTVSALSVLTGMHRKAVVRIYRDEDTQDTSVKFASRLIGQWRNDPNFQTKAGKPRVLSYGEPDSDFSQLVYKVSSDLYAKSVLFDLERLGAVERTQRGLRLVSRAYKPKSDPLEAYRIVSRDIDHLVNAVESNVFREQADAPNFHGTVLYDNIGENDLATVRSWLFEQSKRFQKRVDKYLSKHDLDITSNSNDKGGNTVMLSIFSRI